MLSGVAKGTREMEENNGRYNTGKLQKDEKYDINISFTQKEIILC